MAFRNVVSASEAIKNSLFSHAYILGKFGENVAVI
jgi:hypothetical protein